MVVNELNDVDHENLIVMKWNEVIKVVMKIGAGVPLHQVWCTVTPMSFEAVTPSGVTVLR